MRAKTLHANLVTGVAVAAALVICPWGTATAAGNKPWAERFDLSGATFTVGSKQFTEQLILGQITLDLLKAAHATVHDQTGLAGTTAVRKALTSGKIDMYWEYTGTAWVEFLGHTGAAGQARLFKKVAKQDLKDNGIKWLDPASFSDSYAVATNHKTASRYHLKDLSQLGPLIANHPDAATFCVNNEFSQRSDALPGLEKAYGWKVPQGNVNIVQLSLVYQQVASGQRCNFGSVFTTDGRIETKHLVVLKDNKHFFPPYYAALTMREKTFKAHPKLAKLFRPVAKALTLKTMQHLNGEVDIKGKFPAQVADAWLKKEHFIAQ